MTSTTASTATAKNSARDGCHRGPVLALGGVTAGEPAAATAAESGDEGRFDRSTPASVMLAAVAATGLEAASVSSTGTSRLSLEAARGKLTSMGTLTASGLAEGSLVSTNTSMPASDRARTGAAAGSTGSAAAAGAAGATGSAAAAGSTITAGSIGAAGSTVTAGSVAAAGSAVTAGSVAAAGSAVTADSMVIMGATTTAAGAGAAGRAGGCGVGRCGGSGEGGRAAGWAGARALGGGGGVGRGVAEAPSVAREPGGRALGGRRGPAGGPPWCCIGVTPAAAGARPLGERAATGTDTDGRCGTGGGVAIALPCGAAVEGRVAVGAAGRGVAPASCLPPPPVAGGGPPGGVDSVPLPGGVERPAPPPSLGSHDGPFGAPGIPDVIAPLPAGGSKDDGRAPGAPDGLAGSDPREAPDAASPHDSSSSLALDRSTVGDPAGEGPTLGFSASAITLRRYLPRGTGTFPASDASGARFPPSRTRRSHDQVQSRGNVRG